MSDAPTILDRAILLHSERAEAGLKKYGTDMSRTDYPPARWAQHLQEELADALVYSFRVHDLLQLCEAADGILAAYETDSDMAKQDIATWRSLYRKQCNQNGQSDVND